MKINEHYNMLTALRRSTRKMINGNYYWWFRCDCGAVAEILPANVRRKKNGTKSCGCLGKSRHHGKAWLTRMVYDCGKHAKKLEVSYELSRAEVETLAMSECYYCGTTPKNGIDRVDSEKGYKTSNCVPCCKTCNYMKRKLSKDEFISHIHKISDMFSVVNSVI